MTPLRLWFRSALRRRQRSFIALVVFVGGGLITNSVALLPGRAAARTRPSVVLRTE